MEQSHHYNRRTFRVKGGTRCFWKKPGSGNFSRVKYVKHSRRNQLAPYEPLEQRLHHNLRDSLNLRTNFNSGTLPSPSLSREDATETLGFSPDDVRFKDLNHTAETGSSEIVSSSEEIEAALQQPLPSQKDDPVETLFLGAVIAGNVSIRAADTIWKIVIKNATELSERSSLGLLPTSMIHARRKFQASVARHLTTSYTFKDLRTEQLQRVENDSKISCHKFPLDRFKKVNEHSYLKPVEIVNIYKLLHEGNIPQRVVVWTDGVSESNSRSITLDVFALRFEGCRTIYPFSVAKSYEGEKMNHDEILKMIVADLNDANLTVTNFIADAPKRKQVMKMSSFNSYYGCDSCTNLGALCKPPDNPNARGWMTWPSFTRHDFHLRTREQTLFQATREGLLPRQTLGIIGRSPLFDLRNFDPVAQIQPEAMHMLYLGLTKQLVQLSLNVNPKKKTKPGRKIRMEQEKLNAFLLKVKVPSELSRTRVLDASYKAKDYRNLTLFFFDLVCDSLTEPAEKTLWLLLAFQSKAMSLPEPEFNTFFDPSSDCLTKLRQEFYDHFDKHYGESNCSYNLHQFLHLDRLRALGPINKQSAMPFESSLSRSAKCYAPGTTNIGKQLISNMSLKSVLAKHSCSLKMKLRGNVQRRSNDSLVYVFAEDHYSFFKLREKITDGRWIASKVSVSDYRRGNLCWNRVGSFIFNFFERERVTLLESTITGKAVKTCKLIHAIPIDTLWEDY